jgi:hypothetical protein
MAGLGRLMAERFQEKKEHRLKSECPCSKSMERLR